MIHGAGNAPRLAIGSSNVRQQHRAAARQRFVHAIGHGFGGLPFLAAPGLGPCGVEPIHCGFPVQILGKSRISWWTSRVLGFRCIVSRSMALGEGQFFQFPRGNVNVWKKKRGELRKCILFGYFLLGLRFTTSPPKNGNQQQQLLQLLPQTYAYDIDQVAPMSESVLQLWTYPRTHHTPKLESHPNCCYFQTKTQESAWWLNCPSQKHRSINHCSLL